MALNCSRVLRRFSIRSFRSGVSFEPLGRPAAYLFPPCGIPDVSDFEIARLALLDFPRSSHVESTDEATACRCGQALGYRTTRPKRPLLRYARRSAAVDCF